MNVSRFLQSENQEGSRFYVSVDARFVTFQNVHVYFCFFQRYKLDALRDLSDENN